jgi:hypothetical protein
MLLKSAMALLALSIACEGSLVRFSGYCQQGGKVVTINSGLNSGAQKFQQSLPGASLYVYLTGTVTQASLYSDLSSTPLAQPVSCNNSGYFYFYAESGTYDEAFFGVGVAVPFTLGGVNEIDPRTIAGIVNVVQFGGDPEGVLDSSAALNACMAFGGLIGGRCFVPDRKNGSHGVYKTLSSVSMIGAQKTLECASRGTVISYQGAPISYPFSIGNGGGITNTNTIKNCTFKGGSNTTGASLFCNICDLTVFDSVSVSLDPIGVRVWNSNTIRFDNLVTFHGAQVATKGVELSGAPGTTYADNVIDFYNPYLKDVIGSPAIGVEVTADISSGAYSSTTGVGFHGGAIQTFSKGISVTPYGGAVSTFGPFDMELCSVYCIESAGAGLHVLGGSTILGTIHLADTPDFRTIVNSGGFTMSDSSAMGVKADANVLNGSIANSTFDPQDEPFHVIGNLTGAVWGSGISGSSFTLASHGLSSGQAVTISGTSPAGYSIINSQIIVTGPNTFTATVFSNPGAYVSGGSVTANLGSLYLNDKTSGQISVKNNFIATPFNLGAQEDWSPGAYTGISAFTGIKSCQNCIFDTGTASAGNAVVVGSFLFSRGGAYPSTTILPPLYDGATVNVYIAHTLAATALNTAAINGAGPYTIRSRNNVAGGLSVPIVSPAWVQMTFGASCNCWQVAN